jgi:hypothetical protein
MRHKHYDLIIEWANGAKIQCLANDDCWFDTTPEWDESQEYRVKPKMIKVGRHEWPEPLKEYVTCGCVWTFSFEYTELQGLTSIDLTKKAIRDGVAHATKEAAEQHRAALRCINRGDID